MSLKLICFYAFSGVTSLNSVFPEIKKYYVFHILISFQALVYFPCHGYHINRLLLPIALIV